MKRPLPLRSTTATSTPTIRVGQIDSIAHITEFSSAADHTQTLRKWQELNLPLTVVETRQRAASRLRVSDMGPQRSVFDLDPDRTQQDMEQPDQTTHRWRFRGPWLAGKTPGEFDQYVAKEIRGRKEEFREYIRQHLETQKTSELRRRTIDDGRAPLPDKEMRQRVTVSEDKINNFLTSLRQDAVALSDLIHAFLDLPEPPQVSSSEINVMFTLRRGATARVPTLSSPFSESGPPKTHPSAGLSYLRTASHITNHPLLGPQANGAPIQARVLKPRQNTTGRTAQAQLGVAGIVAADQTSYQMRMSADVSPDLISLRPDVVGGGKAWVHPIRASIDPSGRIDLRVIQASRTTSDIYQGKMPSIEPGYGSSPHTVSGNTQRLRTPRSGRNQRYGVENLGSRTDRPDQKDSWMGFDREAPGRTYEQLETLLTRRTNKRP